MKLCVTVWINCEHRQWKLQIRNALRLQKMVIIVHHCKIILNLVSMAMGYTIFGDFTVFVFNIMFSSRYPDAQLCFCSRPPIPKEKQKMAGGPRGNGVVKRGDNGRYIVSPHTVYPVL